MSLLWFLFQDIQTTGYGPLWRPFIIVSIVTAIVVGFGILVGIGFVVRLLSSVKRSSDFTALRAVLAYHDDSSLLAARRFVYQKMDDINRRLSTLDPDDPKSHEMLDMLIQEASNREVKITDVLRLI